MVSKSEIASEKKLKELDVESWPVWKKEVSEFSWEYDEKETYYILEGEVVVTPEKVNPWNSAKAIL
jgi:uncharacterized cupin superfamily protein